VSLRPLDARQLEALIGKYRAQLARMNGTSGEQLALIARRVEGRIVRELLRADGAADQKQATRLLQAIRRIVTRSDADLMDVLEEHVPTVWRTRARQTKEIADDVFGRRTAERVIEVSEHFERGLTDRRLLRISQPYMDRWAGEWSDEWTRTQRALQAQFTRAAMTGESWATVAKSVTDDLSRLDIAGRLNAEDFARAFTRTKLTELYADAGVRIGEEAGLSLYVSVGVPDDRQSEICFAASQQGPHTLAWWDRSRFGRPPRHVMNCRCTMLAVPRGVDVKQENPKFQTAEKAEEVAA
jgi:hypothetical protein